MQKRTVEAPEARQERRDLDAREKVKRDAAAEAAVDAMVKRSIQLHGA